MTIKLDNRQSQRHSPPPRLRRANSSPETSINGQLSQEKAASDRIGCFKRVDDESPVVVVVGSTGKDISDFVEVGNEEKGCTGPLKKRIKRVPSQRQAQSTPLVSDDEFEATESKKKKRSVRFCTPLVTRVTTRPYTHPDDIPKLFYSAADEARFRAAAYEERQQLRNPALVSKSVVSKAIVVHEGTVLTYHDDDNAFLDDPMFWNGTVTWY